MEQVLAAFAPGVRERPGVRNANRPGGKGATVGTHPEAREKAIAKTTAWFDRQGR